VVAQYKKGVMLKGLSLEATRVQWHT